MREITASEASRNFSALLHAAERGETIVITRCGRRVAQLAPAPQPGGRALRDVFARQRGSVDEHLAANIDAAREAASPALDSGPPGE